MAFEFLKFGKKKEATAEDKARVSELRANITEKYEELRQARAQKKATSDPGYSIVEARELELRERKIQQEINELEGKRHRLETNPNGTESALKYRPGEGIRFTDVLKEAPQTETPEKQMIQKEIKYVPGRGINFSEIFTEVEAPKEPLEKHAVIMKRALAILEGVGIGSVGTLTAWEILKILGVLIIPGGLMAGGAYSAFRWYRHRMKTVEQAA